MEKFDIKMQCEEAFENMVEFMEEDFFAAELAKAERDADFVSNADA